MKKLMSLSFYAAILHESKMHAREIFAVFIKIKEGRPTFVYTLSHNKTNYTTNHWAQKLYMSSESQHIQ